MTRASRELLMTGTRDYFLETVTRLINTTGQTSCLQGKRLERAGPLPTHVRNVIIILCSEGLLMKKAIHRYKYMYAFSLQTNMGWLDLDLSLVYLTLKFMLARFFFFFVNYAMLSPTI